MDMSTGCPHLPHRLLALCDISADPGGSIEFMKECTTIDSPFCLYDADENMNTESFSGDGVLICSIDNMPAQIPRESTDFFGSLLLPYIPQMLESNAETPFDVYNATPVVKDAVIASNGRLTDNYKYIDELRRASRAAHKARLEMQASKRVLILGAGYVSAPVVDYLTRDRSVGVTVASQYKNEVDFLAEKFPNTEPVVMEMHRSQSEIEKLIQEHDLIISLLPYALHPEVAELCIKHKTNMVTASYLSPAMKALHQQAVDAGITVMNEVGVDPGIDHILAMDCFDEAKLQGGKITSFVSWCGGLPAPENSDTALMYKFSKMEFEMQAFAWSPRGALLNLLGSAKYLENNKVVEIPAGGALLADVRPLNFLPGFNLEGYPNRDSVPYAAEYGIETAKTILRGTLRYKGYSAAASGLLDIGLIDPNPHHSLHTGGPDITWKHFMCDLLGVKHDILTESLQEECYQKLNCDQSRLAVLDSLGLFDEELVDKQGSPLDTLAHYLSRRLAYDQGERDLIVMRHDVGIQWADQSEEVRHIDLVVYGDPKGYSAMAATVGYPTGIAAKMILEGEIQRKGMQVPMSADIYRPILKRLNQEGIIHKESVTKL